MAFVGGASIGARSFAGNAVSVRRARTTSYRTITMVKSKAIPFLEAPAALNGTMVGDVGFDPLYLSDTINIDYARAAEIKHGRICMLAALGFVVQEFVHLPGEAFSEKDPIAAIYKVPIQGWAQILTFIAFCELATFKATYDDSRAPGDLGFDPLKLAKTPAQKEKYAEYEIVHCRAAMVGFMGFLLQRIVTGQGVIEQLTNFKPL